MAPAYFKVQINLKEYLKNGYKIKVGDVINEVYRSRHGFEDSLRTIGSDDSLDTLNDLEYCNYTHTIYVNVIPI